MDVLTVSLAPGDTPLSDALSRIRPGTRALVVHRKDAPPLLITAGDIMAAINDALDGGQKPKKIPLHTVSPIHTPMIAPGYAGPIRLAGPLPLGIARSDAQRFLTGYQAFFDENDNRYAIHEVGADTALVVTASERVAADLSSAVIICKCAGDPVHTFEPRQLINPGVCNKPHRKKVTCGAVADSL